MAKHPATDQAETEEAACTPLPPAAALKTTLTQLKAGTILYRVHHEQFTAVQFNPGTKGNARFSPIRNAEGEPIPTLYGGVTKNCAMMETIFHDVSFAAGFKSYDKSKLDDQVISALEVKETLKLVDLATVPLRKLGITRKELIDTEKDQYPQTRQWAEALHQQCPTAQGLSWISRQDDTARAVMLFGDRVARGALCTAGVPLSLVNDATTYNDVLDLAERLDVMIVPGRE